MISELYGNLFMPLWGPVLHQLYTMANHELQHLRSLDVFVTSYEMDHFLYKKVETTPNGFAPPGSDSGQWVEMKIDYFTSDWGSDWFEH